MSSNGFFDRLDECVRKSGLTKTSFLKKAKINRVSYYAWVKKDTVPQYKFIVQMADFAGVSVKWLEKGEGDKVEKEQPFVTLPIVSLSVEQGKVVSDTIGELPFLLADLEKHKSAPAICKVMLVEGDSMSPTLFDGDKIIYIETDHFVDGRVYVFRLKTDILIRRLAHSFGQDLIVQADNKDRKSDVLYKALADGSFTCIGEVIEKISTVR